MKSTDRKRKKSKRLNLYEIKRGTYSKITKGGHKERSDSIEKYVTMGE